MGFDDAAGHGTVTRRPCALVVDGSAALSEDLTQGLAVVPVTISLGDVRFVDHGDGGAFDRFYELLRSGEMPTTSTPAPGEYLEAFRRSDAESIVCLTIPSRWSGMHAAASLGARLFEEEQGMPRVTVLETESAAVGLGLIARLGARLCAERAPLELIVDRLRAASQQVQMYGSLATLTYVARSGRIPSLLAGISNTLHVRPVFRMHGEDTGRVALARTASGAIEALQRIAGEQLDGVPQWVLVFHADALREAAELEHKLSEVPAVARCETVALSPMAGAYTGPGAFGFGALPAPESGS
jgi:DegV family protein with EDD domain